MRNKPGFKISAAVALLIATTVVSVASSSCASAPPAAQSRQPALATQSTAPSASNRITAEDIARLNVPTAYEAVDRLHRKWFRDVAGEGSYDAAVYYDNQRLDTGVSGLRQIPASDVASIEYLKAADAMIRFGQSAKGGAIIVVRK